MTAMHGAVLQRVVVHVVGRDDVAAARHVLHDRGRIAGKIFGHVARDEPREQIVGAARTRAGDDGQALPLKRRRRGARPERRAHADAGKNRARETRSERKGITVGIAGEIVAFLGDDFEQKGLAAFDRIERGLERRHDLGGLLHAARGDVQTFGHLGIIAADRERAVFARSRSPAHGARTPSRNC